MTDSHRADIVEMDILSIPSSRHSRPVPRGVSTSPLVDKKDYAIGVALLLVVVILWTTSNFVTQDLFDGGYDKPFLLTYLTTSGFTVYLVPFIIRLLWRRSRSGGNEEIPRGRSGNEYEPLSTDPDVEEDPLARHLPPPHQREIGLDPLTTRDTAKLAFIFCFLWFGANWSINASLGYTSVASTTILSSVSGFFTLAMGRLLRIETLTIAKIGAVVTSFGGVLLVSLSDSTSSLSDDNADGHILRPLLGDTLALLSAFFYAVYVVLLKVYVKSESRMDMQLFFGFVGFFVMLSCGPIVALLHFVGVEKFELPTKREAVDAILINMAITVISDYVYLLAMLKTTPLVVTVGLSLTIPLAVVGDFLLKKPARSQVIIGAVLVLISFIVVGVEDAKNDGNQKDLIAVNTVGTPGAQGPVRLQDGVGSEGNIS